MINQEVQLFLDSFEDFDNENGEKPLFRYAEFYDDFIDFKENVIYSSSGCIALEFDLASDTGIISHHYTYGPNDWAENSEELFSQREDSHIVKIERVYCSHLRQETAFSQLFNYSRYLGRALSVGDSLDGGDGCGTWNSNCDVGFSETAAMGMASMAINVLTNFLGNECECGKVADATLRDLGERYKGHFRL